MPLPPKGLAPCGEPAELHVLRSPAEELELLAALVEERIAAGTDPGDIAVLVDVNRKGDDATRTLTIGLREGSYSGMTAARTIRVRWIKPGRPLDLESADMTVAYTGAPIKLRMR